MSRATLALRAKQQITLTPRLQQSVKLLTLSALECVEEVNQAIAQNPFLEETPESGDDSTSDEGVDGAAVERSDDLTSEGADDARGEPFDFHTPAGGASSASDDALDWTEWTASPSTLRSELEEQLLLLNLAARDHALASFVIEALDDDGFLREPLSELAPLAPDAAPEELETALKIVQSLEPRGIAARNLTECLTLQLEALDPAPPARALALEVLRGPLELVAMRSHDRLRQALGCTEAELESALELIRSLDPRPGSRLGSFEPRAIVPDVIVRKDRKRWAVAVNAAIFPRIRVNQRYAEELRQARPGASARLSQHLQEARWLVRNLEQRLLTLERVAQAVVARQRTFFEYGDLAMRPLTLREIAAELGLHESTVSRATSHKYVDTPRGIVPFKRFFSRELATVSGGSCSATAIRAQLRELIAAEDPTRPLSDVDLTRLLVHRGVKVARRTVTKYRRSMRLPAVDERRAAQPVLCRP
ncbi:MAG: RNA polymerase factor sigma-54 [Steroidobacteraceae bacterium]